MTTSTDHENVHLIILHHGLWGNVGHVRFIAEQFKQRLGDRLLVVCTYPCYLSLGSIGIIDLIEGFVDSRLN